MNQRKKMKTFKIMFTFIKTKVKLRFKKIERKTMPFSVSASLRHTIGRIM